MPDEMRRFTKDQFTAALTAVHSQGVVEGVDLTLKVLRDSCDKLTDPQNQHIKTFMLSLIQILETSLRNPLHDHLSPSAHRQHNDDLLQVVPPEVPT